MEGKIKVCCCLCVSELQQGGDRHFLCLLGMTENTGTKGVRGRRRRGGGRTEKGGKRGDGRYMKY